MGLHFFRIGDQVWRIGSVPRREESIFYKLNKELYTKFKKKLEQAFAKELGFKRLINKDNNFIFDSYKITDIEIDQYNNLHCKIPQKIPIKHLAKIRRFFNEYVEAPDSYYHRTGTALFIRYFEKYWKSLSNDEIKQMCEIDAVDCEHDDGFKTWLIGKDKDDEGQLYRYQNNGLTLQYEDFGKTKPDKWYLK